ncbi:MAG: glycosyltransferase family A protein [Saccharospirillum sp.]
MTTNVPKDQQTDPGYSVVTFAYNEGATIGHTLRSVLANTDGRLQHLTVIANGCTDDTADQAKAVLVKANLPCTLVEIDLGDKCNAWNTYVHQYLPDTEAHFFVDSDVTFSAQAFPILFDALMADDSKNAVTGLPLSGRNQAQYVELATRYSCLFGNLYGLKHDFAKRLVQKKIRLPIGLNWIDAQITKLVNDNLAYDKSDYQHRVTFVKGVGYQFPSLKPWKKTDRRLYINRICRYKAGQLQEPYLDALPFVDWPETMNEINREILTIGITLKALGKLFILKPKVLARLNKPHRSDTEPAREHRLHS